MTCYYAYAESMWVMMWNCYSTLDGLAYAMLYIATHQSTQWTMYLVDGMYAVLWVCYCNLFVASNVSLAS